MVADRSTDENLQVLRQCAFGIGTFSERSGELFHSMNWVYEHFKKTCEWLDKQPQIFCVTYTQRNLSSILIEQAKLFDEICKLTNEVANYKKMLRANPLKQKWYLRLLFR